jgi:hypothetical protein
MLLQGVRPLSLNAHVQVNDVQWEGVNKEYRIGSNSFISLDLIIGLLKTGEKN